MKKIFLSVGTAIIALTPFISVISCGSSGGHGIDPRGEDETDISDHIDPKYFGDLPDIEDEQTTIDPTIPNPTGTQTTNQGESTGPSSNTPISTGEAPVAVAQDSSSQWRTAGVTYTQNGANGRVDQIIVRFAYDSNNVVQGVIIDNSCELSRNNSLNYIQRAARDLQRRDTLSPEVKAAILAYSRSLSNIEIKYRVIAPKVEGSADGTQAVTQDVRQRIGSYVPPYEVKDFVEHNGAYSNDIDDIANVISVTHQDRISNFDLKSVMNSGLTIQNDGTIHLNSTVYETKYIKFIFEDSLNYPESVVREMIKRFYNETNWGFGLSTMDTIFISKSMGDGLGGTGSADHDIFVYSEPYSVPDAAQITFDTMKHEYGHHETMTDALLMGGTNNIVNNLISHQMPNYQVLDSVINHNGTPYATIASDMMTAVDPSHTPTPVPNIYTASVFSDMRNGRDYRVTQDYSFDLNYHYDGGEILNRPMTILEETAFNGIRNLNGSPVMLADVPGFYYSDANHTQKILDPTTGLYDQVNVQKIVDLWRDYVYGYSSNKMIVDNFRIYGYSNYDFDFVKIKDVNADGLFDKTVKLEKIPTHYLTGRTSFNSAPKWDTSHYAYSSTFKEWGTYYKYDDSQKIDANRPHFFKDTNGNGQLDTSDQEVTNVNYDWNI